MNTDIVETSALNLCGQCQVVGLPKKTFLNVVTAAVPCVMSFRYLHLYRQLVCVLTTLPTTPFFLDSHLDLLVSKVIDSFLWVTTDLASVALLFRGKERRGFTGLGDDCCVYM